MTWAGSKVKAKFVSACIAIAAAGVVLLVALPATAQTQIGQMQSGNGQVNQRTVRPTPPPDMDQPMMMESGPSLYQERRLRELNAAQHKSMVADTDKLLKLVTELNAEINNSNASSLTAEQLRKVAEIEKLAHNVRDKMRTSVRGAGDYMDNSPLPPLSHH